MLYHCQLMTLLLPFKTDSQFYIYDKLKWNLWYPNKDTVCEKHNSLLKSIVPQTEHMVFKICYVKVINDRINSHSWCINGWHYRDSLDLKKKKKYTVS